MNETDSVSLSESGEWLKSGCAGEDVLLAAAFHWAPTMVSIVSMRCVRGFSRSFRIFGVSSFVQGLWFSLSNSGSTVMQRRAWS